LLPQYELCKRTLLRQLAYDRVHSCVRNRSLSGLRPAMCSSRVKFSTKRDTYGPILLPFDFSNDSKRSIANHIEGFKLIQEGKGDGHGWSSRGKVF
jgi:hypothetical protein